MTEFKFAELLQRYLDGRSWPGERQLVERWSARLGQKENRPLPLSARETVRAAIWQRLETRINGEAVPPKTIRHPASAFWRAPAVRWAAAALLVATLSLAWLLPQGRRLFGPASRHATPEWTEHRNTTAQAQLIALRDGSRVTLYPGSCLRYATGFAGTRREVRLVGKAFFKVCKNPARPFLVYTDKMLTTVLGTSFLVQAYAGRPASVAVREGRVSVQARAGAELAATPTHPAAAGVVLLPNQEVVYLSAAQPLRRQLVARPVVLSPQVFKFEKRPVAEVLAALERAYGVAIRYDKSRLAHCTVTITFYDESLFNKLDLLCKALGASYKQADDAQIIFTSSGCQTQ